IPIRARMSNLRCLYGTANFETALQLPRRYRNVCRRRDAAAEKGSSAGLHVAAPSSGYWIDTAKRKGLEWQKLAHRDEQVRLEFSVDIGGAADMDGRAASPEDDANDPEPT